MVGRSEATPLLARVYPNGLADVNHFHAAGGLAFMIGELLEAGLLHADTRTVAGIGLEMYTPEPKLDGDGGIRWEDGPGESHDRNVLRPKSDPVQPHGGPKFLTGNQGAAGTKISAVKPETQRLKRTAHP